MLRRGGLPCASAWGAFLISCLIATPPAFGELGADQLAILANRNLPESLAVARHYANRRGVPVDRIVSLDLPLNETIGRSEYEQHLVLPTRRALEEKGLTTQVRALVTTYGVPLRVAAPLPTEQQQKWIKDATERHKQARFHLEKLEEWVKQIAPLNGSTDSPPSGGDGNGKSADPQAGPADAAVERVATALKEAASRVQQMRTRRQTDKDEKDLNRFLVQFGGTAAYIRTLQPTPQADKQQVRDELDKLGREVAIVDGMIRTLGGSPSDANRQRAYRLVQQIQGLRGVLAFSNGELEAFSYKDGDAGLDSELSLLWWDSDSYRIAGRLANPMHHASPPPTGPLLPILMVSRLDAPTPQLAMQMVDQALETERTGLAGKVYVDARGQKPGPPLSYGSYDQSLRDLAALVRRATSYEVVLEDTERRFSNPGEAPDVALYVGWYRLRNYEDAFTFKPGAIGYHIASGEAVSIHNPDEPGWCKNALERGIAVTLGPTGEPYLDSFPLPQEFFGLLLTGRYSVVEAYFLTTRFLSWRMVLFGDPLYNPWRGRGTVRERDLAPLFAKEGGHAGGLPVAPSDVMFNDPIKTGHRIKLQREATLGRIDQFMNQLEQRSRNRSSAPTP